MRKLALTLVGGFCGAIARYALGGPLLALAATLPHARVAFPYDTLVINLSGALALGFLLGLFEHGAPVPSETRLILGTGFLGAFTTFSSYIVGVDLLMRRGATLAAAWYALGSMSAGVALAFAGYWVAGALWRVWRRRRGVRHHVFPIRTSSSGTAAVSSSQPAPSEDLPAASAAKEQVAR